MRQAFASYDYHLERLYALAWERQRKILSDASGDSSRENRRLKFKCLPLGEYVGHGLVFEGQKEGHNITSISITLIDQNSIKKDFPIIGAYGSLGWSNVDIAAFIPVEKEMFDDILNIVTNNVYIIRFDITIAGGPDGDEHYVDEYYKNGEYLIHDPDIIPKTYLWKRDKYSYENKKIESCQILYGHSHKLSREFYVESPQQIADEFEYSEEKNKGEKEKFKEILNDICNNIRNIYRIFQIILLIIVIAALGLIVNGLMRL